MAPGWFVKLACCVCTISRATAGLEVGSPIQGKIEEPVSTRAEFQGLETFDRERVALVRVGVAGWTGAWVEAMLVGLKSGTTSVKEAFLGERKTCNGRVRREKLADESHEQTEVDCRRGERGGWTAWEEKRNEESRRR